MARANSKRGRGKKKGVVRFPGFKGVETRVVIPEDEYVAKVVEVTEDEGANGPYLAWVFEITEGEFEGKRPKKYVTSFSENSLWNLKQLIEALGIEAPDDPSEFDTDDLVDLELMISIGHETYEGRKQSNVVDFWAVGEGGGSDAGEEAEEEEEEDEPEEKPAKRGKKNKKAEAEEEEEEEDTKPKRGKGKKAGKGKKKKDLIEQEDVGEMTQEELEELIEENDLDLDLSDFRTLKKMRAKVIDALDNAGLLADE